MILRAAWLCHGRVAWREHVHMAHQAGVSVEEVDRVTEGPDAAGWDDFDRLVVRSVDELRNDGSISDDTWAGLAERYDAQQLIELPMLVGEYHLVAWTQNSLGLGRPENLGAR